MSNYDQIATWYDQAVREGRLLNDLILTDLLELAGDLQGKRICDLACGQGVVARELAQRGAKVVGIDISTRLIEMARTYQCSEPLGIRYIADDIQSPKSVSEPEFDGLVCNMSLMDIPDHVSVFESAWRILRARGWFVLSITHPCYQTPDSDWVVRDDGSTARLVTGYFAEGLWRSDSATGVRGQVGAYHRILSSYVNDMIATGFIIEQMREPQPAETATGLEPGYAEVPVVLLIKARKPA